MALTKVNPAIIAAQNYEKELVPYILAPVTEILLEVADPQSGEHVVDVACGTGVVARHVAPKVGASGSVTAIDLNPSMLEVGRSLPAPEGATIDWREGNVINLPLPDAAFDLATCQHGLQFFSDRIAALREIRRVLKPGGRLAVCVWSALEQNPFSKLIWECISRRFDQPVNAIVKSFSLGDPLELRTLLEQAGFIQIQILSRELTFHQPWKDRYLEDYIASAKAVVPEIASMSAAEFSALVRSVEAEIGQELRRYVQDGIAHFPQTAIFAAARNSL